MAEGQRSMLAFWMGGAGASSSEAGARSMLAPWMGGAGSAPSASDAGARSLLAFWMGGASAGSVAPPPVIGPIGGPPRRYLLPPDLVDAQRARLIEDDELLLIVLSQMAASGLLH